MHYKAAPDLKATLRNIKYDLEPLASKFRAESNAASRVNAKRRRVQFMRTHPRIEDTFRGIQAAVCRDSSLKVAIGGFIQRCVDTVATYTYLQAMADDLMHTFVEAGYVEPSWSPIMSPRGSHTSTIPSSSELRDFSDVVLAMFMTDSSCQRGQVCSYLDLEALVAAIRSNGTLVSCDFKLSVSAETEYAGCYLNPYLRWVLVHLYVYARTLCIHLSDEAIPCPVGQCVTKAHHNTLKQIMEMVVQLRSNGKCVTLNCPGLL